MDKENFFDENVYKYIRNNQTRRFFFYLSSIIVFGVMMANELDYVYNSFQFTIIGCKNITNIDNYENSYEFSYFSTVNETSYTFETCLEYGVQTCIPEIFPTTSNTSLSFSVPLFLSKGSPLYDVFSGDIYFIYFIVVIFFLIMLAFFLIENNLYVFRSRAHVLLCMNILIKKENKLKTLKSIFPAFILVFLYSFMKYLMISGFQKDASILMCNNFPIALFFEGKSQSSLLGLAFNFVLFLFIFKDPLIQMYQNTSEHYEELTLTKFVESDNAEYLLERMKSLKYCSNETITKAITKFVDDKYPQGTISKFERKRRTNIFQWFTTPKVDLIPAVKEYYKENPHLFTLVISNQIDENNIINDETTKLIN
ncbi:hypothetical protein ACTFIV_000206 [Dictyostelium citrinum]